MPQTGLLGGTRWTEPHSVAPTNEVRHWVTADHFAYGLRTKVRCGRRRVGPIDRGIRRHLQCCEARPLLRCRYTLVTLGPGTVTLESSGIFRTEFLAHSSAPTAVRRPRMSHRRQAIDQGPRERSQESRPQGADCPA